MLASTLKVEWPQQYIAYLERKLVFSSEDGAHRVAGNVVCAPWSDVRGGGSEIVVWKS